MTKEDAEGLFQRLTSGSTKDDFAVFFNRDANVPAEAREELLAILRSRFGGTGPSFAGLATPSTPGASTAEPAAKSRPREAAASSVGSATFGANPPLDAFTDWSYDVNFLPGRAGEFDGFSPFVTLMYGEGKATLFDLRELEPVTLGLEGLAGAWHGARLTPDGLFRPKVLNQQTAPNLHALLEHIRNEIWPAHTMDLMKVGFVAAFGVVSGTLGTISRPAGGGRGNSGPRRLAPRGEAGRVADVKARGQVPASPAVATGGMTVREAAVALKTPPPGYRTMDAFGKALGWGRGANGGREALQRAATITAQEARALGVSGQEAARIRDAYRAVLNDGTKANNPTALGREVLMSRLVRLLSE